MRVISHLLLGLCSCVVCVVMWSSLVCMLISVPYVDAMVAVTVMHVYLFVLRVSMVRVCEGESVRG